MRYYSNDWVYTAAGTSGGKETKAGAKATPKGNEGLANILALLLPLIVITSLYLLMGGKKDDAKGATVFIVSGSGSGAGCVLTTDGYILTNRRVIADTNKIRVVIGSGTSSQQAYDATLVKKGAGSAARAASASEFLKSLPDECAILKIPAKNLACFQAADASKPLQIGAKVSAIGYSATQGGDANAPAQQVSTGTLSGFLPGETDQRLLLHTCVTVKGFNGGALIDEQGKLLGIIATSAPADIGANKQAAIPLSAFKATLNDVIQGSGH